jgi:hypothetical protein
MAGKGSAGRSTVAGDRVAAGTPFAGQTPVISGSGEVEHARRRAQSASNTWLFASVRVLPSAERPKHANLALRPARDLFPVPRAT